MRLYKLTNSEGYTRNRTLWGRGVTHRATGSGGLCTSGVIHAYEHPLIAAFMNPAHADFSEPILWLAEGEITHREGQLKCGVRELTTIRRVKLPTITQEQRIRISIYCVLAQYKDPIFEKWAKAWLANEDRTTARAAQAARTAWDAARNAAWAAWEAAQAARNAAWAAWEAAQAARTAWDAARNAAMAARDAAMAARAAKEEFDLLSIIKRVVEDGE